MPDIWPSRSSSLPSTTGHSEPPPVQTLGAVRFCIAPIFTFGKSLILASRNGGLRSVALRAMFRMSDTREANDRTGEIRGHH